MSTSRRMAIVVAAVLSAGVAGCGPGADDEVAGEIERSAQAIPSESVNESAITAKTCVVSQFGLFRHKTKGAICAFAEAYGCGSIQVNMGEYAPPNYTTRTRFQNSGWYPNCAYACIPARDGYKYKYDVWNSGGRLNVSEGIYYSSSSGYYPVYPPWPGSCVPNQG